MKYFLKSFSNSHTLFLIPAVILLIISLKSNTSAYYNAKYEPPDGKIYHGVGWYKEAQINYMAMFSDNRRPLLVQNMIPLPGNRGMTTEKILNSFNAEHLAPDSQYMEMSTHFTDNTTVLDSVFAYTNDIDSCIDTIAIALKAHNKPVFLRIGLEMNGAWNGYTPWTFPKAYRKLVEELRARGVENIATVWCYEPDAPADFADSTEQGWKWYPGDDVVDWFSLDPFPQEHFNPSAPDSISGQITKKGKSELFLRFAQERRKPVYINETTAHSVNITPDSLDTDSTDGIHDWEYWFKPFLEFLNNHPNIKAFNYINLDWTPFTQWTHWGDARIHINSYIRSRWVDSLSNERFLCAGYEIPEQTTIKNFISPNSTQSRSPCIPVSFNSMTNTITLWYNFPGKHQIIIELYTFQGKLIERVINKNQITGQYRIARFKKKFSNGIYTLIIRFENCRFRKKIAITR